MMTLHFILSLVFTVLLVGALMILFFRLIRAKKCGFYAYGLYYILPSFLAVLIFGLVSKCLGPRLLDLTAFTKFNAKGIEAITVTTEEMEKTNQGFLYDGKAYIVALRAPTMAPNHTYRISYTPYSRTVLQIEDLKGQENTKGPEDILAPQK